MTSAFKPSITERACAPDPPCDCSIVTSWPCSSNQCCANCLLNSAYNSRVGSYETFNNRTRGFVTLASPIDFRASVAAAGVADEVASQPTRLANTAKSNTLAESRINREL